MALPRVKMTVGQRLCLAQSRNRESQKMKVETFVCQVQQKNGAKVPYSKSSEKNKEKKIVF